jgi:sigma-B regulation protein RsbU (phosphoserine phosphatase)
MKCSIRTKLVLGICLPLAAVYLLLLVIEYRRGKEQALEQMKRHLTELAAHQASQLDTRLTAVAQVARSTADFLTTLPLKEEDEIYRLIRRNLASNPRIFGTCVAFEPGAFRADVARFAPYACRSPTGEGLRTIDIGTESYDYTRWDWYLLPKLLGRPAWTDPYFDEGAGNILMCTYSVPFHWEGRLAGVVTADVSLEHLRQEMADVDIQGGYCLILSQSGTIVSHPREALILSESIFSLAEWYDLPELAGLGREMIAGKPGVWRIPDFETGQPKWAVVAPVSSTGWSLAAMIPEEHVLAPVHARVNRQMYLLLTGLGVITLVVLVVSGWITRPLARLAAATREVARGNLDVRVTDIRSRDEIREFADTFNRMLGDLKSSVEARIRETAAREAVEKELQVARQIQTSLLPKVRPPYSEHDAFSLYAANEPAKVTAGDFYDFWFVDDDRLAVVIADVSGKGLPAAMFMAVARTVIRNFSAAGRSPAETLAIANRVLTEENEEQMFVTVFLGHYHVRTGELIYANGGHNPPLVARHDGRVESLGQPTGPLLAVLDESEYGDRRIELDAGDLLLLYTDGVTEARNEEAGMFGEEGLARLLSQLCSAPPEEICRELLDRVNEHRRGEPQDDVTLLALKRMA